MSSPSILRREFRYTYFNATLILIAINAVVFGITNLFPRSFIYLSLIPAAILQEGWIWQFFTYMFVHASYPNIWHLLFNMLGLFFFGTVVERKMGSKEFLLFYLLTGTLAGIFSFFTFWLSGNVGTPLVGASGALYAVLFAFAVISPRARIYYWGIIPIPAPLMVLGLTLISLFYELFGFGGNIAHLTHLAGFAFAALYFPVRHGVNPIKRLLIR